MNNIVAYIKEKLNSNFIENIVKNNDLSGLESDIKRFSEEICLKAYKSFLEDYDKMLKLDENRDAKYVVQRLVSKNLITTLGTMNLIRTKYYDKMDKRYFCLLDEKLNLPQYERFTPLSFAKILDEATNTTYERAGKNINSSDIISKGTIYNKIRKINVEENYIEQPVIFYKNHKKYGIIILV